jgi:16S rRNA (uracil1498-N3)-methyltransferase
MLFRIFEENPTPTLIIQGENAAYIRSVLRLRLGGQFEVVSGIPEVAVYEITGLGAKVEAKKINQYLDATEPERRIHLAIGLMKGDKLDLVLQKATELGVASFIMYGSDESPVVMKNELVKRERWQRIIRSAVCQSRRTHEPAITICTDLRECLDKGLGKIVYAEWIHPIPLAKLNDREVTIIVGPESGFSNREKDLLKSLPCVSLSPRTLRAETAAIAAVARLLL